jgi:hypothetical protein
MASERPTNEPARPAGAEGDGMDRYPTYRDGPETTHRVTATKPTDVGLPRSRRTFALPLLIGLAVFALVIVIRIVWGSMNMAGTADDALSPGQPANAPINAPTAGAAGAPAPEAAGTLDRDVEAETTTGAGEVEATPGGADVPGGAQTEPPTGQPAAPAQ